MEKVIFGNPFVKSTRDGIVLDNVPLNTLKHEIKPPFYIILAKKIRQNIQNLQSIVQNTFGKEHVRFSYSVKANYMKCVLNEINNQHIPFELISQFEYNLLKQNYFNTDNLIVGGPYLPDSLIESVIQEKNPLYVLYNDDQIQRVNSIAKNHKTTVNALLRFTAPKINGHLGFSPNDSTINHLEKIIPQLNNINFKGIHSHYGTQINTYETYKKNTKYIIELAKKIEKHKLFTSTLFDIGGGLPNAGSLKENQLNDIFSLIKDEFENHGISNPSICLEPGRHLVEDAGLFVMEIIYLSENSSNLFVNAGTYILPRFARNSLRFYNVDQRISHYNKKITIYGIVPSEEDILVKNYNFSSVNEIGNRILVMNCGAYAHTFSTRFPYQIPPVVLIDGASYKIHSLIH